MITFILKLIRAAVIILLVILLFKSVEVKPSPVIEAADIKLNLVGDVTKVQREQALQTISQIKDGDTVYMRIGGDGGIAAYGMDVFFALLPKKTYNVCRVILHASSMTANYLLLCDKVYTSEQDKILFHMPYKRGEDGQKVRDVSTYTYGVKLTEVISLDDFLSDKYLTDYYAGKDVRLNGTEFLKLFNQWRKNNE